MMTIFSRAFGALALGALSLPLVIGCGGSSSPTTASQQDSTLAATSGSTKSNVAGDEAEPAQSVAIFLDSLRKGDERAANGVLTTLARQELAKTAYIIQPLGTPAGQYKIGRVGFPYPEDPSVALVECTWSEPPLDGQTQETMEIVCEVHKEAEGWRISGIGVTIPGTDQALVLDFEDAASLQATIDAATGNTSPRPQTQVANGQPTFQPELPAYPTGFGVPQSENTGYPQIALPQLNNAPVNR